MSTSTTCHGFVANTWRKDVCTNCFRLRDEHSSKISVTGRFATNKFNSSSSSSIAKTTMNNSRYSAESGGGGGFHPSNSGDYNKDNTLPRINVGSGTSVGGRSVNMTQSHFGAGSTLSNFTSSHHHNQKQPSLHGQKNKPTLHFTSGTSNSGGGSRHQSNVNFASGGNQPKSDIKSNRNSFGMDAGDGGKISGSGSRKPQFSVGGPMRGAQKGILKSKDGSKISKSSGGRRGVSFPVEVVEVIGFGDDEPYGGTISSTDEDEEDTPVHPLDNASIAELLDKSSTTLDEKEFYRLTQKNTNFNSIKTNLLGKTNIEIGPIVGGTGGSAKPLVSIGTFETRNEPLRIRKKIDEDSFTDENDKTVNTHRKFVTTTNKPTASTSTLSSTTAPARSPITSTTPALKPVAQVPTTLTPSISASSVVDSATSTIKSMQNLSIGGSPAKHAIKSTKVSSFSDNSSASTSTTKTVNYTTKYDKPKRDDSSSKGLSPAVTIASAKDLSQWSDPDPKNEVGPGSSSKGPENKPALKPKSILKCGQPMQSHINSNPIIKPMSKTAPLLTSPISKTIPPILSNKTVQLKATSSTTSSSNTNNSKHSQGLTNLIILTEGNSIASKRTSFLRNIIENPEGHDTKNGTSSSSNANGVTIVSTSNPSSSLEPSLEKDSLDSPHGPFPSEKYLKPKFPSKLKLNIDLSLNRDVANPPKSPSVVVSHSLRFNEGDGNGSGTDSEFDDSLEDSGLDIKVTKPHTATTALASQALCEQSDEKLGGGSTGGSSGSDSGNENDYTVSNNKCNGRVTKGHPGLYISVEDQEIVVADDEQLNLTGNKPSKLSPDSVLFNGGTASGSEMSVSGSNESISECLQNDDQMRRSSTTSTTSTSSKRQAPLPPNTTISPMECPLSEAVNDDDVYDDIVNVQMMMTRLGMPNELLRIEDESIYDDCSTIYNENDITITPNSKNSPHTNNGKIGSYSFGQESSTFGEHNDEDEPVIMQKSDGIEFIGIRKIDSESFLKERSPTPERKFGFRRSVSPSGKDSRERSSSTSPKARRKVNQFFSTIGKKAGAAFSNSQLGQYARNKSPSVFNATSTSPDPTEKSYNGYKRSMSTDEVSAIRSQEIYATVTPTTMKFKGVLNKLSKMDLTDYKSKGKHGLDEQQSSDLSKKKNNNISKSIKKFLRFGNKDGDFGDKVDFSHHHPPLDISSPIHTPVSLTSSSDGSSYHNSNPPSMSPSLNDEPSLSTTLGGKKPPLPGNKPPPPPPRIHSLDMLQKMGVVNQQGTVRPARPPPPVRPNQNTPRFVAVFNNPAVATNSEATVSPSPTLDITHASASNFSDNDGMIPPCKPRRKNSVNHSGVGNRGKDLETSYNHISNLNLETLKLIANQALTKIFSNFPIVDSDSEKVLWSQFDIQTGMRPDPLIHGIGFAIYATHFQGTKCLLMIQEYSPKLQPFQFSCVQTDLTSQGVLVPNEYIPWNANEISKSDSGIDATLSVLPFFKMWKLEDFINSPDIVLKEKHLALLQSLEFWELEELSNLLVFRQPHIISSDRIYIHPLPVITGKTHSKDYSTDFEVSIKQLLFTTGEESEDFEAVLSSSDKQILIEKVSGDQDEVKSQLKLFFQLKLFAPPMDSGEFAKIRKYRSEHAIQNWLDKERALCMKEAVERSLSGSSITLDAITPLKKAYLEFLMRPGNSAKAILDMFVELFE